MWGLGYAAAPAGVYYLGCEPPVRGLSQKVLHYWDAPTRRDRVVLSFDGESIAGLSVSPDGSTVLLSSRVWTANLMMIDNFR